jgi:hypothetical protein
MVLQPHQHCGVAAMQHTCESECIQIRAAWLARVRLATGVLRHRARLVAHVGSCALRAWLQQCGTWTHQAQNSRPRRRRAASTWLQGVLLAAVRGRPGQRVDAAAAAGRLHATIKRLLQQRGAQRQARCWLEGLDPPCRLAGVGRPAG